MPRRRPTPFCCDHVVHSSHGPNPAHEAAIQRFMSWGQSISMVSKFTPPHPRFSYRTPAYFRLITSISTSPAPAPPPHHHTHTQTYYEPSQPRRYFVLKDEPPYTEVWGKDKSGEGEWGKGGESEERMEWVERGYEVLGGCWREFKCSRERERSVVYRCEVLERNEAVVVPGWGVRGWGRVRRVVGF